MEGCVLLSSKRVSVNPKLVLATKSGNRLYDNKPLAKRSFDFERYLPSKFARGLLKVLFSQFKLPSASYKAGALGANKIDCCVISIPGWLFSCAVYPIEKLIRNFLSSDSWLMLARRFPFL